MVLGNNAMIMKNENFQGKTWDPPFKTCKHSQNSKAVPCANYVNIARRKRVKTAFCANKMFAYGNE